MTWLRRLLRLPLRLVRPASVRRVLTGDLRGARWIAGAATHGCWLGTYERESQQVFRDYVKPGDTVFDVGANAGFFTLLASRLAGPRGRVYAFEPLPRNVELLDHHIRLNDVRNVEVLPIAASSSRGTARFQTTGNAAMGMLSASGELEVATDALDRLVADGKAQAPRFLKIDVEGAEHDVLRGAAEILRDVRPVILLSAHGWEQHDRCVELLRGARYTTRELRDGDPDGNYVMLATPQSSSL